MASINVCDWPGCGAALGQYPDTFDMRYESLALHEMVRQHESGSSLCKIQPDPSAFSKDLCRTHSVELRRRIEDIFDQAAS